MATFIVTNLNDSGAGSLRAAIVAANGDSSGTPTVVNFAVAGTINLLSDLFAVRQSVNIDATSAPTYVAGGPPVVEINANNHGGVVFAAGSSGSQLLGLAIDNASGNGVTLDAGSITLNNNYIGLNLAGAAFGNRGDGVFVSATSSNNQIGLNTSGVSGVVANVISGNVGNGISFHGSSGNTVAANRIGTSATGTSAIANGGNGIWVTAGSNGNEIGGAVIGFSGGRPNDPTGDKGTVSPLFVVPPLGNLVSGNGQIGILIDTNSQNNVLNGNFVGTIFDGNAAIANAGDGVWINGADNNSLIGCQVFNNPFVYYNVVSGNGGNGLEITNSNNAVIQGNFFGVGSNNATLVANHLNGILVDGSSQNTQVGGVIPLGNVVSGNSQNGIEVTGTVSGFVTFNTFGGLLAFGGAAANGNDGLLITSTGGNNTVRTNVFSGNTNNGIEIGGDASGVTVDPNIVGLTTNGQAALPNGNDGLLIDGTAHDNAIGGYIDASVIPNQTFSGNNGYGVAILGQAHDNSVFNNFIGTNVPGTVALGNREGGVLVGGQAKNNVIGGTSTDPAMPTANLISGNTGNGVTLNTGMVDNTVVGNSIGVDRFGFPLPNTGQPIVDEGAVASNFLGSGTSALVMQTTSTGGVSLQTLVGTTVSSTALNTAFDSTWSLVGIGDFNGSGTADLLYRQASTGLTEVQLIGQPVDAQGNVLGPPLSPVGGGLLSNNPFDLTWNVATAGDFNGDGNADIVWRQPSSGLTEIQFLSGTQAQGGGAIVNNVFDQTWNIIGSGDFNRDGNADLVWQEGSSGPVELQYMNGITPVGGGLIANNPFGAGWKVVGVGNFNGDGISDLVWQQQSDSLVELQYMSGVTPVGGGVITNSPFGAGWNVVGVGDYNRDGQADLIYQRGDGMTEVQYLNGLTPVGGGILASSGGNFNPGTQYGIAVENLFTHG